MAKEEAAGPGGAVAAAAVAAMEKHIAMHSIYAIPPSAGAMPPSPQTQRPGGLKHSSSREEAAQEEQDYLSTPHSKYFFSKNLFHRRWWFGYHIINAIERIFFREICVTQDGSKIWKHRLSIDKKKMLGIFSSLKKRGKILRIKIGDLKRNVDWVFIIVACVGNTSVWRTMHLMKTRETIKDY